MTPGEGDRVQGWMRTGKNAGGKGKEGNERKQDRDDKMISATKVNETKNKTQCRKIKRECELHWSSLQREISDPWREDNLNS